MASVQGIHLLAKGSRAEARRIAPDIQQHQRLLVGPNTLYGAGVYAWHPVYLPKYLRHWPQVLFEIDDVMVVDLMQDDGAPRGFFVIPGAIGSYVTVHVVEVVNVW